MLITCNSCRHTFEPGKSDQEFVIEAAAKGMRFAMVDCPNCPVGTEVDPVAVVEGREGRAGDDIYEGDSDGIAFRCPVTRCAGFVSYVAPADEQPFWGCGACGSVWYEIGNLYNEIAAVSGAYPYRRRCYERSEGKWLPSRDEPENYDELIMDEPSAIGEDYLRG